MKKYILISLLFHLSIFLFFKNFETLGNEDFNKVVPITFVATKTSPNPGSPIVAPKEVKKKEKPKPKPKKEKKKEKKIKSKVVDTKKKKEEVVEEISEEVVSNSQNTKENEAKESTEANVFAGSNFMADGDGGYIALSSAGIHYEIINEVEPNYPSQAEMISYSKKVVVSVKFLVNLKGGVEKIEIIKSHSKLGFDSEVKKAIKKWRFKPIYHHGKNIKVYFVKDFIFNPK